jgi:hypothetical protein
MMIRPAIGDSCQMQMPLHQRDKARAAVQIGSKLCKLFQSMQLHVALSLSLAASYSLARDIC